MSIQSIIRFIGFAAEITALKVSNTLLPRCAYDNIVKRVARDMRVSVPDPEAFVRMTSGERYMDAMKSTFASMMLDLKNVAKPGSIVPPLTFIDRVTLEPIRLEDISSKPIVINIGSAS